MNKCRSRQILCACWRYLLCLKSLITQPWYLNVTVSKKTAVKMLNVAANHFGTLRWSLCKNGSQPSYAGSLSERASERRALIHFGFRQHSQPMSCAGATQEKDWRWNSSADDGSAFSEGDETRSPKPLCKASFPQACPLNVQTWEKPPETAETDSYPCFISAHRASSSFPSKEIVQSPSFASHRTL